MYIDLNHLHHWMQAIRQSPDPIRTMDAFWMGQLQSKEWLISSLANYVQNESSVDIHGGWVGVLASMLFQSKIPVTRIRSIDIDPSCEPIAINMNKLEEIDGRFQAITSDMCTVRSDADIIINTSCEHITQEQYDVWLSGLPHNSLIVVQSNNYDSIQEHVRTANSIDNFIEQSKINVLWANTLKLQLYNRYMIIGKL